MTIPVQGGGERAECGAGPYAGDRQGRRTADAYGEESRFIADRMAEAESVSARKATLFDSTGEDETIQVLRRRLFEEIDQTKARTVVDAYRCLWTAHGASLSAEATRPETVEAFLASYPLHPEVLETLTGNFRLRKPMNHEQFCRKPVSMHILTTESSAERSNS